MRMILPIALCSPPRPRPRSPRRRYAARRRRDGRGGRAGDRRTTGALLDVDVGPIIDAADPYGPRGRHRTLREIAGRGDPRFERRLRTSIYESAGRLSRAMEAFAAAEPALRRSMRDMEAAIAGAVDDSLEPAPRRLPPGEVDDDWDPDLDEEGPDDEPY